MSVIDFGVLLHVSLVFSPLLCATHSLKESIFSPFSSLECVNYWVMCQGLDFVKQVSKASRHIVTMLWPQQEFLSCLFSSVQYDNNFSSFLLHVAVY